MKTEEIIINKAGGAHNDVNLYLNTEDAKLNTSRLTVHNKWPVN